MTNHSNDGLLDSQGAPVHCMKCGKNAVSTEHNIFKYSTSKNGYSIMISRLFYSCILVLCLLSKYTLAYQAYTDYGDIFNHVYVPGGTLLNESPSGEDVPFIRKKYYRSERRTRFSGHFNHTMFGSVSSKREAALLKASAAHYANRGSPVNGHKLVDSETDLSYETVHVKSGRRVVTFVEVERSAQVRNTNWNKLHAFQQLINERMKKRYRRTPYSSQRGFSSRRRNRRAIYGKRDERSQIPIISFGQKPPYSFTVKISVGCTGILISPRHVLTAAHCLYDSKDYNTETKMMKVGILQKNKTIEWIPVSKFKISNGFVRGGQLKAPYYDYALLKLSKKHNKPFIRLSISENEIHGSGERIGFTSFEDDKPEDTLWYRSCNVEEDDKTFLYHYCDAQPGSSGSGVYAWSYDSMKKNWVQELVGVFSGYRWKSYDDFGLIMRKFNVAVRLSSAKYAQICEWMGKVGYDVCHKLKKRRKQRHVMTRKDYSRYMTDRRQREETRNMMRTIVFSGKVKRDKRRKSRRPGH